MYFTTLFADEAQDRYEQAAFAHGDPAAALIAETNDDQLQAQALHLSNILYRLDVLPLFAARDHDAAYDAQDDHARRMDRWTFGGPAA